MGKRQLVGINNPRISYSFTYNFISGSLQFVHTDNTSRLPLRFFIVCEEMGGVE